MDELKAKDIIGLVTRASGGQTPMRLGDIARRQILQYVRKSELFKKWKGSDDYDFTAEEALKLLKKFVKQKWHSSIHDLDANDIIIAMQTDFKLPTLG